MLTLEPDQQGPSDPIRSTPPRRPGSARRTTSIDTSFPDGFGGDLIVDARARDLLTTPTAALVTAEVRLSLTIDGRSRTVRSVDTSVGGAWLSPLVGRPVGSGFRRALDELWPSLPTTSPALHLLLDDLPGSALVSGYAMLRAGVDLGPTDPAAFDGRADLCAGWVGDGVMMVAIRRTGRIPTPVGPVSPMLELPDDPLAWHVMAALPPGATRRRRRLDVHVGDGAQAATVDAMFRDSHAGHDGPETTVHEYAVTAEVDVSTRTVTDASAMPHVLPWVECPAAAASAPRLAGRRLERISEEVRADFHGPSTCTHLNDTLRGVGGATSLLDLLDAPPAATGTP